MREYPDLKRCGLAPIQRILGIAVPALALPDVRRLQVSIAQIVIAVLAVLADISRQVGGRDVGIVETRISGAHPFTK